MKFLIFLLFLTGITLAQNNITAEDRVMSEHVREVWHSATKNNYQKVFAGLISDCENYLNRNPNTAIKPGLLGYLFEMKAAVGEPHDVLIRSVDSLLEYDNSENTIMRVSKVLIQRQIDIKKAIELLKPIATEQENNPKAYDINLLMAAAKMHLNDYKSAIKYLNYAVNLDPERVDAYEGLQQAYKFLGKPKGAEKFEKKIADLKIDKNIDVSLKNFNISDINGKNISMSEFTGQIVSMIFFSFDCPYCKKEFPTIANLIKKYPGIKFLFVNLNESVEGIKNKFIREVEFSFLNNQTIIKFSDIFDKILDITITPQVLVIDKNSVVKYDYRGYEKDLEGKFEENIKDLQ